MQAFPFDSRLSYDAETGDPLYDRAVSSQPLRELIKKLFTTGVMPNPSTNYQVGVGSSGMELSVQSGFAVVDGGLCKEDDETILELESAHATYNRIDTVVLQWDENVSVRDAKLYIKKGTPSRNPSRPEMQRNNSIYEIGLADVLVVKNTTTITADKITDTRYESERCGIVSSVSEWDTTTIYNQIQADLAEFKSEEQAEFLAWFETIQDILDENVAAHLQNEIDDINDKVIDTDDISSALAPDYSKSVSHIGMIIHSTTLNTEAKVKSIYGGNSWIQLSGYVLRGATSGVTANSNQKDLGSDDAIVVDHKHSIPALSGTAASKSLIGSASFLTGNSYQINTDSNLIQSAEGILSRKNRSTTYHVNSGVGFIASEISKPDTMEINATHGHTVSTIANETGSTGSSGTNKNIPNEKNVYMWERVS